MGSVPYSIEGFLFLFLPLTCFFFDRQTGASHAAFAGQNHHWSAILHFNSCVGFFLNDLISQFRLLILFLTSLGVTSVITLPLNSVFCS